MHQLFQRHLKQLHLPLFWLPICFYFLFGLQYYQPNMGGAGTDLPFNLVGWIFVGIALSVGFWQLHHRNKLKVHRQLLTIGICLFALYVPFLYGKSLPQISTWYRFLAIPLLFLLTLFSLQYRLTQRAKLTLISVIFLSSCAQLFIAIYQLFSPSHPFAPFGHFQQTNLLGSFLITGYACLIYLISEVKPKSKHQFRWLAPSVLLISFLIGFMTLELNSRGTLLSACIVSLFALIFAFKNKKTAVLISITSFMVGFFAQLLSQSFNEKHINAPSELAARYQQDYDREILYPQTLELISKNLFLGVGYGNFESAYTLFSVQSAHKNSQPENARYNMDHPHNEALFWFAEGGIIAGLAVMILLLLLIYWLVQQKHPQALLIWGLFTPIGLHSLTEYPLHASLIHLLCILIFVRLFVLQQKPDFSVIISKYFSVIFRPVALITSLTACAFGLTGLHTVNLVLEYEKAGGRSSEPYVKIVNPLVHYDRYWSNIMAHKAIAAANTGNKEGMLEYITWAQAEIKHHPKQTYFENVIRLKHHLNMLETEDCVQYELYFPKKKCADLTH